MADLKRAGFNFYQIFYQLVLIVIMQINLCNSLLMKKQNLKVKIRLKKQIKLINNLILINDKKNFLSYSF